MRFSIRELAFLIAKIINYQGNIIFDESMPDGTKENCLIIKEFYHWDGSLIFL